jgi:hypothetical protein
MCLLNPWTQRHVPAQYLVTTQKTSLHLFLWTVEEQDELRLNARLQ